MDVYIIEIDWDFRGESGHDILDVCDSFEKAKNRLKEIIEDEKKTTWLSELEENEFDDFEVGEDYFFAESFELEGRTEIHISKFNVS